MRNDPTSQPNDDESVQDEDIETRFDDAAAGAKDDDDIGNIDIEDVPPLGE
jgi:hypothetical protein